MNIYQIGWTRWLKVILIDLSSTMETNLSSRNPTASILIEWSVEDIWVVILQFWLFFPLQTLPLFFYEPWTQPWNSPPDFVCDFHIYFRFPSVLFYRIYLLYSALILEGTRDSYYRIKDIEISYIIYMKQKLLKNE